MLDKHDRLNINNNINTVLNNINIKYINKKGMEKARNAETLAYQLVEAFNSPQSFLFYCKVAHTLPECKIWDNHEAAMKAKKTPVKLFNWLCRKDMNARD